MGTGSKQLRTQDHTATGRLFRVQDRAGGAASAEGRRGTAREVPPDVVPAQVTLQLSAIAFAAAYFSSAGGLATQTLANARAAGAVVGDDHAASATRRASFRSSSSRCGRHVVEVAGETIRLDGAAVVSDHARAEPPQIAVAPRWRRDCGAVAWVEVNGGERRLVVIPSVAAAAAPALNWTLPPPQGSERIFWIGRARITVGATALKPRAVASWS